MLLGSLASLISLISPSSPLNIDLLCLILLIELYFIYISNSFSDLTLTWHEDKKSLPILSLKWHNRRCRQQIPMGPDCLPIAGCKWVWDSKTAENKMDSLESMCNLKINISWIHYCRTYGIHYTVTIAIWKIYELLTINLGTKLFTMSNRPNRDLSINVCYLTLLAGGKIQNMSV